MLPRLPSHSISMIPRLSELCKVLPMSCCTVWAADVAGLHEPDVAGLVDMAESIGAGQAGHFWCTKDFQTSSFPAEVGDARGCCVTTGSPRLLDDPKACYGMKHREA